MTKKLTGYALLRSVCTKEEKRELTKVKKVFKDVWEDTREDRASQALLCLFYWKQTTQGFGYWKSVYDKLRYQEETQGW